MTTHYKTNNSDVDKDDVCALHCRHSRLTILFSCFLAFLFSLARLPTFPNSTLEHFSHRPTLAFPLQIPICTGFLFMYYALSTFSPVSSFVCLFVFVITICVSQLSTDRHMTLSVWLDIGKKIKGRTDGPLGGDAVVEQRCRYRRTVR